MRKEQPWKRYVNYSFTLASAILLTIVVMHKQPDVVKLSSNTRIVTEMDSCIVIHGSAARNDDELNRIYKQCWNHSKLVNREQSK